MNQKQGVFLAVVCVFPDILILSWALCKFLLQFGKPEVHYLSSPAAA
jgi:hypothetical protein